ncbi:hypothetical protein [Leptolyngbya sp. KIOST-1]|uniref:hypothetical protein n=1 Tax=Leptolyngbya sp. KIOST-1 TaxID=1229172 RepID=UPI000B002CD5|nr:hypothetical protein [Leptolyngbya sp. KIOST-1]
MVAASLVDQAKGGDAAAIAALMNQALQPKGITVQGDRQGTCLQLWLTGHTLPTQSTTVDYVQRGLARLQVSSLTSLEIYAEQADRQAAGWGVEVDLATQPAAVRPLQAMDQEQTPPLAEPPEALSPEPTPEPASVPEPASPLPESGTIAYAYALLGLEQGEPLQKVEGTYFKLKALALREGDRAKVEELKQAFHQLKTYIENPAAQASAAPAPAKSTAAEPIAAAALDDETLTPEERVERLLKQRGVAAQVKTESNQLHISWMAVRVINPEDAAAQVHTLLTQQQLASLGLPGIETLMFMGLSRDNTVVWHHTTPLARA